MPSYLRLLFAVVLLTGCDSPDGSDLALYEVEVDSADGPERFRLALSTDEQVDLAEGALASGREGVIHGTVLRGDGGFNAPYAWHLAPESITFPDLAMEVCDGRPRSDVERDVDYWADTVGVYCPWGARVLRRIE